MQISVPGKFIVQCEFCKKPILRENPAVRTKVGGYSNVSATDIDTGEPVVLPNVWCKHCKKKNLFDKPECFVKTDELTKKEKELLNVDIKSELGKKDKDILSSIPINPTKKSSKKDDILE